MFACHFVSFQGCYIIGSPIIYCFAMTFELQIYADNVFKLVTHAVFLEI